MQLTVNKAPLQSLPNNVQERIWEFVRGRIKRHEESAGAKVSKFEIHVTDGGQIEVEMLSTQTEKDAAIDAGLEEGGLKDEVNRLKQREELSRGDAAVKGGVNDSTDRTGDSG